VIKSLTFFNLDELQGPRIGAGGHGTPSPNKRRRRMGPFTEQGLSTPSGQVQSSRALTQSTPTLASPPALTAAVATLVHELTLLTLTLHDRKFEATVPPLQIRFRISWTMPLALHLRLPTPRLRIMGMLLSWI
jgi:hypothetical protein